MKKMRHTDGSIVKPFTHNHVEKAGEDSQGTRKSVSDKQDLSHVSSLPQQRICKCGHKEINHFVQSQSNKPDSLCMFKTCKCEEYIPVPREDRQSSNGLPLEQKRSNLTSSGKQDKYQDGVYLNPESNIHIYGKQEEYKTTYELSNIMQENVNEKTARKQWISKEDHERIVKETYEKGLTLGYNIARDSEESIIKELNENGENVR